MPKSTAMATGRCRQLSARTKKAAQVLQHHFINLAQSADAKAHG